MIIKEAIINSEIELVKAFLKRFDLEYAIDIDKTYYLEIDEKIVGTISCSNYIIKCLAVDEAYQSENVSTILINQILDYFNSQQIYHYMVYTKPQYEIVFKSFGFKTLVKTNRVVMLEGGSENIFDTIHKMKVSIEFSTGPLEAIVDVASLVINANPMTIGHENLIEKAAMEHKVVIVFVLEEDKSEFSFKERFSLVYLATRKFGNVVVVPSTKYIISSSTFPTYFLKDKNIVDEEYALVDCLIFKDYFMKELNIKYRYVGTEENLRMKKYNDTLKQVLNDNLIIVDRFKNNNQVVSASTVRQLLKNNQIEEALKSIPNENIFVFKGMIQDKRYLSWK